MTTWLIIMVRWVCSLLDPAYVEDNCQMSSVGGCVYFNYLSRLDVWALYLSRYVCKYGYQVSPLLEQYSTKTSNKALIKLFDYCKSTNVCKNACR